MIKIKCFGVAKEIVQAESFELQSTQLTVGELRKQVVSAYSEFANIKGYMVAINQEYATDDMSINGIDEVAIIPPVSGG